MNDLIMRKDVEQMLKDLGGCDASDKEAAGWDKAIDTAMEGLRKVEIADRWIPCSERLPEKSGDCQVTIKDGEYYVCPFYLYFDRRYWRYSDDDSICHYKILAWRYVPEPWKGE